MGEPIVRNLAGIPIYQFVAWSGTGKTTFLEKLVRELKKRGMKVGVYKHDGHDFEIDRPGKDSWRMTQAGADVTVLSSAEKAVIMENRPVSPEDLTDRIDGVDIILIEGYKSGPWRKIGLFRKGIGKGLPVQAEECLAVITDADCPGTERRFGFSDVSETADFLQQDMAAL